MDKIVKNIWNNLNLLGKKLLIVSTLICTITTIGIATAKTYKNTKTEIKTIALRSIIARDSRKASKRLVEEFEDGVYSIKELEIEAQVRIDMNGDLWVYMDDNSVGEYALFFRNTEGFIYFDCNCNIRHLIKK